MSEETIPLNDLDDALEPQPVPVPVPPPGGEEKVEPVPVPAPSPAAAEEEKIALVDWDEGAPAETQRKTIGSKLTASNHKEEFKRSLNMTGQGATRCRLFRSKIADSSLLHMENNINEWLDGEDVEIKFATQCIGTVEGKRPEPNLLVMVWY